MPNVRIATLFVFIVFNLTIKIMGFIVFTILSSTVTPDFISILEEEKTEYWTESVLETEVPNFKSQRTANGPLWAMTSLSLLQKESMKMLLVLDCWMLPMPVEKKVFFP